MSARTTESGLLAVLRMMLYELNPAERSRFVGIMQTRAELLSRHLGFEREVQEAAVTVLAQGPSGRKLTSLYAAFDLLYADEQAKILELVSRNGTTSGSLEDELLAWDRARRA